MVTAAFRLLARLPLGLWSWTPRGLESSYTRKERNDGKRYEIADVPKPIEDKERRVIPNKAKWFIVYTIQMSKDNFDRAPTPLGNMTAGMGYDLKWGVQRRAQEFLRGLGYMGIGEANTRTNALAIAPALGVLAGLGELGRFNRMTSLKVRAHGLRLQDDYGPAVGSHQAHQRGHSGVLQILQTCAECCPSKALSFDTEPSVEVKGKWNNPGTQNVVREFRGMLPLLAGVWHRVQHLLRRLPLLQQG